MSSYINFYIRSQDNFISIGDFCRSSCIYQAVKSFAPYEKLRPLNRSILESAINNLNASMENTKHIIENYQNQIKLIATFNNSADEKIDAISDYDEQIKGQQDEYDDLVSSKYYMQFLLGIIEANKYVDEIDENELLFMGEEVGSPTVNDIVQAG